MKKGFTVWLEEDGKYMLGEKEAGILEGIKKYGSLMATAKSLGITYAHAWNVIEELTRRVNKPLVSAYRGGDTRGGTCLTDDGESLLSEYLTLEQRASKFFGASKERIFTDIKFPDLSIIGSSCPAVKLLAGIIEGYSIEIVEVGSLAGMTAVMLGEADLGGMHLYDPESKTFNVSAVQKQWPSGLAVLIRGYTREQGLILKKGNPKGLRSFDDIIEKNARLVNRNLGSGTRELLDRILRESRIPSEKIRGYDYEVRTHEEVAKALAEGRADAGIGLRAVASVFNLDFEKLFDEQFDFVCDKRRLNKPSVKAFIEALKSKKFMESLERKTPGIRLVPNSGEIIEIRS